jgi:hypothetical protein
LHDSSGPSFARQLHASFLLQFKLTQTLDTHRCSTDSPGISGHPQGLRQRGENPIEKHQRKKIMLHKTHAIVFSMSEHAAVFLMHVSYGRSCGTNRPTYFSLALSISKKKQRKAWDTSACRRTNSWSTSRICSWRYACIHVCVCVCLCVCECV